MKVSELGEVGLIDLVAKMINGSRGNQPSWQQLILGIGDDAAAWRCGEPVQLATTDSLIQDIHFSLATASWEELGWKALAVNLSDIAAMGGVPRYALVSLALPPDTEVENVTRLYQGMLALAQQFGVAIVGGDTDSAPLVAIYVTVIGEASGQSLLTRSAARVGDKIAVTGYLGSAAAGLRMLHKKLQFDPEATTYLRQAFLRPQPRIAEGQLLIKEGVKTAIDISDGLVADLTHICRRSQVSARIEMERVPIAPAVRANFGGKSRELALSGGEDYELLFTAPAPTVERAMQTAPCPITVIGEITKSDIIGVTVVDRKGNPLHLDKAGWEHFTT